MKLVFVAGLCFDARFFAGCCVKSQPSGKVLVNPDGSMQEAPPECRLVVALSTGPELSAPVDFDFDASGVGRRVALRMRGPS